MLQQLDRLFNNICTPLHDKERISGLCITVLILLFVVPCLVFSIHQLNNIVSNIVFSIIVIVLTLLAIITLHITRLINPNILKKQRIDYNDNELINILNNNEYDNRPIIRYITIDSIEQQQTYCRYCNIWRDVNTFHCYVDNHCVVNFDHHCSVLGACIGQYNHRFFTLFLLICGITGIIMLVCDILWLLQMNLRSQSNYIWSTYKPYVGIVLVIFHSEAAALLLFGLFHSILIIGNTTSKLRFGRRKQKCKFNIHKAYYNTIKQPIVSKYKIYNNYNGQHNNTLHNTQDNINNNDSQPSSTEIKIDTYDNKVFE